MAEVRECMENPFDHYGLHPLRGTTIAFAANFCIVFVVGPIHVHLRIACSNYSSTITVHLDVDAKSADSWYKAK